MKNIKEIKKAYGIKDKDIAEMFGYKNAMSYANAKEGKKKIERGLEEFFDRVAFLP